jgi:ABC-type dipeptide/oligopeptide/nickel transport system permease subunit
MAREELPSRDLLHAEAGMELGAAEPRTAMDATEERDAFTAMRVSSPSRDAWRRFHRNWAAMISLAVILIIILMALFAPFMHTSGFAQTNFDAIDQASSGAHWFGTDQVGRDEYSRIVYGLRIPLFVGILGTIITVIIGTTLGLVSGYSGGTVDSLISRFTDLMFAFPGFTLALIVISSFGIAADRLAPGGSGRVILLTIVFALVQWPPLMRFVRSLALSMKEQQFIEAARTCGSGPATIIRRHLLPNMYGLILVQGAFIVVAVISTETVLSIFGLTVQPPNPDLGAMLYDGVQAISGNSYWQVLFPGLVLAVLILAFTFVADGVRDAVDPRARG